MSAPENPPAVNGEPGQEESSISGLWLFAVAYSGVGFSVYFALGVVAERGLGLTPLIFLVAGLLYGLTTLTYMEGGAMFQERGGSATLARHAFNELISFIAGWAILIDFLIVIALAAISVPHYLTPLWSGFGRSPSELIVAGGVIGIAVGLNTLGITGRRFRKPLAALAAVDVVLQLVVIAVGVAVVWDPGALTAHLDLFGNPAPVDIIYAAVLATVAYAGIEAAANLAPELRLARADLGKVVASGALVVPLLYAGMAVVALMALPVTNGPHGPETQLAHRYLEAPVLGVVASYDPAWLADVLRVCVMFVASIVLVWAAYTAMLGVSRVSYVMATNRQIPSWIGRLGKRTTTPFIVIAVAGGLAFALDLPADVEFLAGIYAFGATLAITIAHLSVIRLRVRKPDRERPFRIPLNIRVREWELPLPAMVGALIGALAWGSVVAFHGGARIVGGGWMVAGLLAYVAYRGYSGTSLTKRVEVTPESLKKEEVEISYRRLVVPVFATPLDDDIVGTAGRIAAAAAEDSKDGAEVHVVFVHEVPVTFSLDARLSPELVQRAGEALVRAFEIADEYEGVNVSTAEIRDRSIGHGIVTEAADWGAEVVVLGAEPPSPIRHVGWSRRPPEIGVVTEYVLRRAPCRVLLTAAPEEHERAETKPSEAGSAS